MNNQVPTQPPAATPPSSPQTPRPFIKTLWEIRFISTDLLPQGLSGQSRSPPVAIFIPSELMPTADAEFLLNLMGIFHSASKKMMDELMHQVTGLAEFTEADAPKNLEIAKMISWLKLIQQMIERLRGEIT
jgi:hypothetical protein